MAYIGNKLADSYTSFAKQDFTTSATTSYTLDYPVTNANEIALFINFVRQEPTTAYTASGTTLTLSSATSASDDMYAVFLGKALQTVNPPAGSVGISQLSATGTKDSTTFLRGDNTFANAGGVNTPAFEATMSGSQSVSSGVTTKAQFDSELLDTDSCYDNTTNYRFTPTVAGKYFVYGGVSCFGGADSSLQYVYTYIRKNGSTVKQIHFDHRGNNQRFTTPYTSVIVDMNGSTDYVEMYGLCGSTSSPSFYEGFNLFGAYKIIE